MKLIKIWILSIFLLITTQSAFSQTPPPEPPQRVEEIVVTGTRTVGDLLDTTGGEPMGFWEWLVSTLFGLSSTPTEVSACKEPSVATTVSTADALERQLAANAIIQPMFQGLGRQSHNGEIIRIRFADGGTEDYLFAAAASMSSSVPGTLVTDNGIAKPC